MALQGRNDVHRRARDDDAPLGGRKPEDERPEMTGTYRVVYAMRIDPTKVGDAQVFRTWGYEGTLIVSEAIKQTAVKAMAFDALRE